MPDPECTRTDQSSDVVVDAIRLALAAGADDAAKVAVIEKLVGMAPRPDWSATEPVAALIEAVKASRAEFALTEHA